MRSPLAVVAALGAVASLVVAGAPVTAAPQADPPPVERYVALGDSYTAAPLVPQLDVAAGCFRSTNNYPAQVARELAVLEFVDVSCSGADTADMTASQLPGVGPQLDALTPETDLVTVSIGGNDFGVFGTLVGFCPTLRPSGPTGSPCRDRMRTGDEDLLFAALAQTRDRVTAVVAEIKDRSPQARVLVVGYPQIAPRTGTCPGLLPLADRDADYALQINRRLTDALKHAAAENHVGYVDVWTASKGHDICADEPWINGQFTDPVRAQSFHPFLEEQTAVADLLLESLR